MMKSSIQDDEASNSSWKLEANLIPPLMEVEFLAIGRKEEEEKEGSF